MTSIGQTTTQRNRTGARRDAGTVDLKEVGGCMLLRVRRLARRAATIYDRHLEPVGLNIGQFGLLAQILALTQIMPPGGSLGTVAERFGMDPTTLNRSLKPLAASGWVTIKTDPNDRRARIVSTTAAGRDKVVEAVPYWRAAEAEVEKAVGRETMRAMNGLIDQATSKLIG
ncbi:MAG TPA: MarR family winged helix-turn-helix transcriptional regulator [Magnetospirillaceae bacterium]|jgi:DNA-binding MarR family transcriptional regulator